MTSLEVTKNKKNKVRSQTIDNHILYNRSLITRHITLPITKVNKTLYQTFDRYINENFEGKCIVEGFVKPASTKIISYSSGSIKGSYVLFEVVFECFICNPSEGMLFKCEAINITKAGIRASIVNETPSPLTIFITRDHYYNNKYFSSIEEGNEIIIKVIGCRYELNDKYISVIASLVDNKNISGLENKPYKQKLIQKK